MVQDNNFRVVAFPTRNARPLHRFGSTVISRSRLSRAHQWSCLAALLLRSLLLLIPIPWWWASSGYLVSLFFSFMFLSYCFCYLFVLGFRVLREAMGFSSVAGALAMHSPSRYQSSWLILHCVMKSWILAWIFKLSCCILMGLVENKVVNAWNWFWFLFCFW